MRTPEESSLDSWADVMSAQEKRALLAEQERWKQIERNEARKHERRNNIWSGLGILAGFVIVGAIILGIALVVHNSVEGTREGDIQVERERTAQVQACTALEEPLERQYCLLSLGLEPAEEE